MSKRESQQNSHLTEYYYTVTKHKRMIITCFLLTVGLTMLFTFLMKPVYRATATLVIEKERSTSPVTGERLDYESFHSESLTFNTHFKLITSRPVLGQVIREARLVQLDREGGLEGSFWQQIVSQFEKNFRLLRGKEEVLPPDKELIQLHKRLKEKIDIEQIRDTRLLRISVEDRDEALAKKIADTLAEAYIEFNIANRLKTSRNTLSWLTDQLYEMKKKLEDAEEEFLNYKQQEKLFSVAGKQKVIAQKIEEFNDVYIKARNRRLELDTKLAELKRISHRGTNILYASSLIQNPVIDNLYTQLLDSEVELSSLSKVFKSKHPKVVQIETKIEETNRKLRDEVSKERENLKAERSVLFAREKVLQDTLTDFEKEALATNRKELKYAILERNVETNQKLYETLLSKIKESDIVLNVDVSNIRIAEEAMTSADPVKPRKKLNVILSMIFGLIGGVGLAFFWDYLDRTLRNEEDVWRYLDLPVLSIIPKVDGR